MQNRRHIRPALQLPIFPLTVLHTHCRHCIVCVVATIVRIMTTLAFITTPPLQPCIRTARKSLRSRLVPRAWLFRTRNKPPTTPRPSAPAMRALLTQFLQNELDRRRAARERDAPINLQPTVRFPAFNRRRFRVMLPMPAWVARTFLILSVLAGLLVTLL